LPLKSGRTTMPYEQLSLLAHTRQRNEPDAWDRD
jgi:hypothetical protein